MTLWTVALPGSSVHELLPGKNTGVGHHALLQGGLPDSGIEPMSLISLALAGWFFTTSANWEASSPLFSKTIALISPDLCP